MGLFENREKHPCYGLIGFSRRTGGEMSMFGSSIKHKDVIAMTLKHAEVARELNSDHYFGHGVIAEVEMSYTQFAEAISAMNIGDGVPCTIRFTEKDGYVGKMPVPFTGKNEQFKEEFKEHLEETKADISKTIDSVKEIFDKKTIGKNDKAEILKMLEKIESAMGTNSEFIYSQFTRQMDKTINEAKGEIEAFWQNKMNSIALAALAEKETQTLLDQPVDVDWEGK